ncbi:MAG: putative metalloprotease CJM1_0395 family protein [Candidatus Neomarinimicrobiota bacterium]
MNISPLTPQSVQAGYVPPETRFPERVRAGPQTTVDRPSGDRETSSREDAYVPSGLAGSEDRQSGGTTDDIGLRLQDQRNLAEGARTAGSEKAAQPAESPSQLQRGEGTAEQSPEEKARIAELKRRDTEVRRHEQAHVAAAGRYARGGANFQYVLGPDGKLYAVGGEVQIDTSEVPDDPEATIRKAQTVRRAALAPSNPSSQDQRVAAAATQMEFEARMELSQERTEQAEEDSEGGAQGGESDSPQSQPLVLNLFV